MKRYTLSPERPAVHAVTRQFTACGLLLAFAKEPKATVEPVDCRHCLDALRPADKPAPRSHTQRELAI